MYRLNNRGSYKHTYRTIMLLVLIDALCETSSPTNKHRKRTYMYIIVFVVNSQRHHNIS